MNPHRSPERLRIGVASHNFPPHPGGLETLVQGLTRGFSGGHEVVVVTTAWDARRGVSREDGATIYRLPAWHGAERQGVPYATPWGPGLARAYGALRSCDVIHAHGCLYTTTLLALLARRRRVPLIVTEHVGFVEYPSAAVNAVQKLAWLLVGRPVARRAARLIAYNSRVHDWLAETFGSEKVAFIANGVDTTTFAPATDADRRAARARLGLPSDEVLALFVGREAEKKNLGAVLGMARADYRLVVCGAERRLGGDVLNLGVVPHDSMSEVFCAADFLLHAATGEGFPVAIQEAMASGLPVVLLWDSGYAGSVDREALLAVDTLAELERAAARIAVENDLRRRLGAPAREYAVESWNWNATVQSHLDLFVAAIESG